METKRWIRFLVVAAIFIGFSTVHAATSVELIGGTILNGDVVSWDGKELQMKTEFGTVKLLKDRIAAKSIERLELSSANPEKLLAKIAELEATIASLRRDNALLRGQVSQSPAAPATVPSRVAPVPAREPSTTAPASTASHSISSTGKRHNSNCRYYGSGRPCGPNDGVACKICGG